MYIPFTILFLLTSVHCILQKEGGRGIVHSWWC